MIGFLQGKLLWHSPSSQVDQIILLANGVGYELSCPIGVVDADLGQELSVWVHSITREDGTRLYGFAERSSMEGFRMLLDISGVGAKVGMALLSAHSWNGLCDILYAGDVSALTQAEGVGKKIAGRIALEMSSKLKNLAPLPTAITASTQLSGGGALSNQAQATSALVNLGYSATVAQQALKAVPADQAESLENLIAAALRTLSAG